MEVYINENGGSPKIWIVDHANGTVTFGSFYKGWQSRSVGRKTFDTENQKKRGGYLAVQ